MEACYWFRVDGKVPVSRVEEQSIGRCALWAWRPWKVSSWLQGSCSSPSRWIGGSLGSGCADVPYKPTVVASRMTHLDSETGLTCSRHLWLTRPWRPKQSFANSSKCLVGSVWTARSAWGARSPPAERSNLAKSGASES